MKLWYEKPAQVWSEALPVGNGTLGGMVFGGITAERIQLNEDSVWGGRPLDRHNPDAKKCLPEIRRLLREKKIAEAERLTVYGLSGTPESQRVYQTAGNMYLNLRHGKEVTKYHRELDLTEGIVKTGYCIGETTYYREVFSSYPDQVMVIYLKAEGKENLALDCRLDRCRNWLDETFAQQGDTVGFWASTGEGAISFWTKVKGVSDGTVKTIGDYLIVEGAGEVCLYLNVSTSYRQQDGAEAHCDKILKRAAEKGYEKMREAHVKDYQRLFTKVSLSLAGAEERFKLPTDVRIADTAKGIHDPGLYALYYQYSRYLLLSSSRDGSLPANLQGIWNDSLTPPWDSKYTININAEMNYWLAGASGLTACEKPFFDLLQRVKENGKHTAQVMYGCRGSVAHHNTDIYADTAPQDTCISATYWVMGEAWMATHIWTHYQYTQNKDFLAKHFDVLEQCVLFFEDFLIEGPDNTLVTSPSISPENTYILPDGTKGCLCEGPMMDTQILNELFMGYINACEILGKDEGKIASVKAIMECLPKMKIGKHGQLQEWMEDYEEEEPGHRHISHLYGVYPGTSLSWSQTPKLMQAAKNSLHRRLVHGGGHTGWSRAWMISLWARFLEAEKAHADFCALLAQGTYPNMMDNHPLFDNSVFQIDGNMGAAAAVTEMLVQDYDGRIVLLPALPKAWSSGEVTGLGLRGGMTLDMKWADGKVKDVHIYGADKESLIVVMDGKEREIKIGDGRE